jgi:hypothetical protein
LPLGIKDSLKENILLLAFWLLEGKGFLDVGGFWKGGLLDGDCWKEIAGRENEWLKGNC